MNKNNITPAAMNYKIKIENAFEEEGKIDLRRLAEISDSILHIAEGALQIRLTGISFSKGRKVSYLTDAISITFTGIYKGSTVIELECEPFKTSLGKFQMDLFKQDIYEKLMNENPVSLVINSFNDALTEKASKDFLDKPLITELKKFRNALKSPEEKLTIINQGVSKRLTLKTEDFNKIEILESETPEPQSIILNGIVDVLEYSKTKAKIITKTGTVEAYLGENITPDQIRNFWGKEVSIYGLANYKPGGSISSVKIDKVFEPGMGDEYFSVKPKVETVEQQIEIQVKDKYKRGNPLKDIVGKWPGDETDDEFDKILRDLDS